MSTSNSTIQRAGTPPEDGHQTDDRGTQVGLKHEEQRERRHDEDRTAHEHLERIHALIELDHDTRAHEHERDLHELGNLDGNGPDVEPALRTKRFFAQCGRGENAQNTNSEFRGHELESKRFSRNDHANADPNAYEREDDLLDGLAIGIALFDERRYR